MKKIPELKYPTFLHKGITDEESTFPDKVHDHRTTVQLPALDLRGFSIAVHDDCGAIN